MAPKMLSAKLRMSLFLLTDVEVNQAAKKSPPVTRHVARMQTKTEVIVRKAETEEISVASPIVAAKSQT